MRQWYEVVINVRVPEAVERRHLNVILQNDEIKVRARPRWQRYDGRPLLAVAPQATGQTKMRALLRVALGGAPF